MVLLGILPELIFSSVGVIHFKVFFPPAFSFGALPTDLQSDSTSKPKPGKGCGTESLDRSVVLLTSYPTNCDPTAKSISQTRRRELSWDPGASNILDPLSFVLGGGGVLNMRWTFSLSAWLGTAPSKLVDKII